MAQLAGTVGPQFVAAGTSNVPVRLDAYGAMVTSGLRGNFAELASRRQVFSSYVTTVATSLAATATIGNMIWNPPGSGVRLELLRWVSQIVATSATCTGIAIAGGYQTTTPTTTTAATATGCTSIRAVTLSAGQAFAYSIATVLTAPVIIRPLHHNTAAIATVGEDMQSGTFDGEIVVEEGGFVTLCALGAAAAASGHTSGLIWAEVATR